WRNDLYIIGDEKVTLIHKRPLWLQNEVEQVLLDRVDNVLSETSGLLDTVFQRGDVKLSLVGEGLNSAKVFEKVHRPHEVQAEISRRQARARINAADAEDQRQRATIQEYLSAYHDAVSVPDPNADVMPVAPIERSADRERAQTSGLSAAVGPAPRHDLSRPPHVPRVQDEPRRPTRWRSTDSTETVRTLSDVDEFNKFGWSESPAREVDDANIDAPTPNFTPRPSEPVPPPRQASEPTVPQRRSPSPEPGPPAQESRPPRPPSLPEKPPNLP
ncbi:MAG: hypothetical protein AAF125_13950, partial [Chloroflexota bacterium]